MAGQRQLEVEWTIHPAIGTAVLITMVAVIFPALWKPKVFRLPEDRHVHNSLPRDEAERATKNGSIVFPWSGLYQFMWTRAYRLPTSEMDGLLFEVNSTWDSEEENEHEKNCDGEDGHDETEDDGIPYIDDDWADHNEEHYNSEVVGDIYENNDEEEAKKEKIAEPPNAIVESEAQERDTATWIEPTLPPRRPRAPTLTVDTSGDREDGPDSSAVPNLLVHPNSLAVPMRRRRYGQPGIESDSESDCNCSVICYCSRNRETTYVDTHDDDCARSVHRRSWDADLDFTLSGGDGAPSSVDRLQVVRAKQGARLSRWKKTFQNKFRNIIGST